MNVCECERADGTHLAHFLDVVELEVKQRELRERGEAMQRRDSVARQQQHLRSDGAGRWANAMQKASDTAGAEWETRRVGTVSLSRV